MPMFLVSLQYTFNPDDIQCIVPGQTPHDSQCIRDLRRHGFRRWELQEDARKVHRNPANLRLMSDVMLICCAVYK